MNSIASRPIDRLALAYISARCRICGGTYIDGVQGISGYLNCDRKTASQSLRRLCEAGAIVSAGSLGRIETYMINGETAPAGDAPRAIHHGQIPPIDGENLRIDGEELPPGPPGVTGGYGQNPPIDGENLRIDGEELPPGPPGVTGGYGQNPPIDGEKPPIGEADGTGAEEEIRPIDGENLHIAASTEGYSHGRRIPINGANLPIDGQGEPINGEKPPIDGENLRIRPHMDGLKDKLKYIHPSDPSTGYAPQVASEAEIATALARLKGLTENPNRLRQAEAPYRALIGRGIAPDQIERAWVAWQDRRRDEVTDAKYMPQLTRWLEDDGKNGAAAQAARQKKRKPYYILRSKDGFFLHDPRQDRLIPLLDDDGSQLAVNASKAALHAAIEGAGYRHG